MELTVEMFNSSLTASDPQTLQEKKKKLTTSGWTI